MKPLISTIYDSAIYKAITQRSNFTVARTVSIRASRSDNDWEKRLAELRSHCADNTTNRWRIRAPMSDSHIHADFEDEAEALLFMLRFG